MRIESPTVTETPFSVSLALSDAEAADLAEALGALQSAGRGCHERISDFGGQSEITGYREDD